MKSAFFSFLFDILHSKFNPFAFRPFVTCSFVLRLSVPGSVLRISIGMPHLQHKLSVCLLWKLVQARPQVCASERLKRKRVAKPKAQEPEARASQKAQRMLQGDSLRPMEKLLAFAVQLFLCVTIRWFHDVFFHFAAALRDLETAKLR